MKAIGAGHNMVDVKKINRGLILYLIYQDVYKRQGDEPRTEEPVQPAPAGEKAGGRAPEGEQQEAGAMPKKIRKGRKRNEKQPSSDD